MINGYDYIGMTEGVLGQEQTYTFIETYPTADDFLTAYNAAGYPESAVKADNIKLIYNLLYANYGTSHFAGINIEQTKAKIYSIIWQYGPTWERRVEIQESLRKLSDDDLISGSRAIYNAAHNPDSAPSTNTLKELEFISEQNTTNYRKSKMEAYNQLLSLLETDVTQEFINRFKKLFLSVAITSGPQYHFKKE